MRLDQGDAARLKQDPVGGMQLSQGDAARWKGCRWAGGDAAW